MNVLWNSAIGLLVVTGGLLGLTLPSARSPPMPACRPSSGPSSSRSERAACSCALLLRGERIRLNAHRLRYFIVTAAISYALPNLLMFSVMPHVGAGYTGIMFTLSPVITLVLSILLGVGRPNLLGVIGIAVGFVGAVMVAATRGEAGQPAALIWVAIALLIPLFLATGNIYRTIDWPKDAGPIELAVGSHLAAAAMLLAGILVLDGRRFARSSGGRAACHRRADGLGGRDVRLLLPAAGGRRAGLSQPDRLCRGGGRLFSGTLFLGERYELSTWLGAADHRVLASP